VGIEVHYRHYRIHAHGIHTDEGREKKQKEKIDMNEHGRRTTFERAARSCVPGRGGLGIWGVETRRDSVSAGHHDQLVVLGARGRSRGSWGALAMLHLHLQRQREAFAGRGPPVEGTRDSQGWTWKGRMLAGLEAAWGTEEGGERGVMVRSNRLPVWPMAID
jgi:hypothetical protein